MKEQIAWTTLLVRFHVRLANCLSKDKPLILSTRKAPLHRMGANNFSSSIEKGECPGDGTGDRLFVLVLIEVHITGKGIK